MSKYSLDAIYQVWNDTHGSRVEVGNDSDGLDLVEIRQIEYRVSATCKNEIVARITMDDAQAELLVIALQRRIKDIRDQKEKRS